MIGAERLARASQCEWADAATDLNHHDGPLAVSAAHLRQHHALGKKGTSSQKSRPRPISHAERPLP